MTEQPSAQLAAAALAAKELAERNRTKRNLVLFGGVCGGVFLALAVLLLAPGRASVATTLVVCIAIGAALGSLANVALCSRITPVLSSCPSCGHPWEIKEGRSVPYRERMPQWDKCPTCELPMRTELLRRLASLQSQ